MRKKCLFCLIVVTLSMALSSCATGTMPHNVKDGELRDTLFSVEKAYDGRYRVFVTHDDVAGYCSPDIKLGEKAKNLLEEHDGEVIIKFRDVKQGDAEWMSWYNTGCYFQSSSATDTPDMYMFMMTDITAVDARGGKK